MSNEEYKKELANILGQTGSILARLYALRDRADRFEEIEKDLFYSIAHLYNHSWHGLIALLALSGVKVIAHEVPFGANGGGQASGGAPAVKDDGDKVEDYPSQGQSSR